MNNTIIAFPWAIVGAILGGAFTYFATRFEAKLGARSADRARLLMLRTESFARLWSLTGEVPRNPSEEDLKTFQPEQIIDNLSEWYFLDGGIYLSSACRDAYFNFLQELEAVQRVKIMESETYVNLYRAASALRHSLAIEIDARTSIKDRAI